MLALAHSYLGTWLPPLIPSELSASAAGHGENLLPLEGRVSHSQG